MRRAIITLAVLIVSTMPLPTDATPLDAASQQQFDRFMQLSQKDLAGAARQKLEEKYPDEDWSAWDFPDYVFNDLETETSYKIAAKEPRLLGEANISDTSRVIPCYCTCDNFGHENLLYCFFRDGNPDGEFDKHGSICTICMRQTFLALLWSELGADHDTIMKGMEKQFAPIVERFKQRNK